MIFVTAHDAFAVRAFESHAVDYLLKPFSDERFQAALDRAIRSIRTRGAVALLAEMQALLGRTESASGATSGADRARPPVDHIVLKGAIASGCFPSSRSVGSRPRACTCESIRARTAPTCIAR